MKSARTKTVGSQKSIGPIGSISLLRGLTYTAAWPSYVVKGYPMVDGVEYKLERWIFSWIQDMGQDVANTSLFVVSVPSAVRGQPRQANTVDGHYFAQSHAS